MKKDILNLKLNTCAIAFFIVAFSAHHLNAQNKQKEFRGNKLEQKADKCDFIIHEQGDCYVLYNKANSLMIYESDFESRIATYGVDGIVKFENRTLIDSLVHKIISPFFKDYKSKYPDDVITFDITLYAKPDGKICELLFSCPSDAKIPLKAIEKLENGILSLGLKLNFNFEKYKAVNITWIYYPLGYSVFTMKEKLKAEKK